MNALVSIIIPAYNSEKWIKHTIESALSQTWKNKEIIVVDDGSTDKTFEITKQYESTQLKVISQENKGACAARNNALNIAQGEYIQWLDADDLLAPNKIEVQLSDSNLISKPGILHSAAWGYFYYRLSKAKFNRNKLWQDLSPNEWLQIRFGEGGFIPTQAWLVSRRLTEIAGLWDERLRRNQDGEYFCRVVACSEFVKFHADAKSYYRKGNLFSISMTRSKSILESIDLSNDLCVDHFLKLRNDEKSRQACVKYLQKFIQNIQFADSEIILKNQKRIRELGGEIVVPAKSKKFTMFKIIFGTRFALVLKERLWNLEITIRRQWDRLLASIIEG